MRTILTIFAGFAAVPLLLWVFIAAFAMISPATRDYLTLGVWLLGALAASGVIMLCGFIVGLVVPREQRR